MLADGSGRTPFIAISDKNFYTMKLAVSGCAGIGKSTLSQALAKWLKLDVIDEHYEALFDEPNKLKQPAPELEALFRQVLDGKHALEQQYPRFVTDRCPIDLFHLWLVHLPKQHTELTNVIYEDCRRQSQHYDFVVLPNWGSIPLQQVEQPSGYKRRVMDPWVQLRNHASIVGLAHLWLPGIKLISIPQVISDHEQRVHFILNEIQQRQAHLRAQAAPPSA